MASGRLGNQKTLVFHWFFKVLEERRDTDDDDEKKTRGTRPWAHAQRNEIEESGHDWYIAIRMNTSTFLENLA